MYDESATDTLRNSHVVQHEMKREYSRPGRSLRVDLMILLATVGLTLSAFAEQNYQVAVVPSDDPALVAPVERTQELSTEQIEAMVRRAVGLAGGLEVVIPEAARLVVLKPNVGARPGTIGVVTDARVVRAVALMVHEAAPDARIYIGAGSGSWLSPDLVGTVPVSLNFTLDEGHRQRMFDGFRRAGLRDVERELQDRGIDIECFDLNFDRAIFARVPGGGMAADEYAIAASILEADAWIDVPVAKTHGAKITAAMKNQYGLLPGHIYGWNKGRGTDVNEGIPHAPRVVDESFVDLMLITEPDFVVTDLIRGSEGGAFNSKYRRSNVIVAGRDPIAADLVTARLMGFNPDDFEFAELAARRGRGPGEYANVEVRGALVEPLVTRWIKAGIDYGGEWQEQANYGKGPRRWSLYGPADQDHEFEELSAVESKSGDLPGLEPGVGGWSNPVWFGHDRIDLDLHFDDPVRCAVYAWTNFTMPEDGEVRLWLGADEGLQVWIDGEPVYSAGRRSSRRRGHRLGQVRLPWHLTAGEHQLIVRADQGRGPFEFSFNICEPIDDIHFAGNSHFGVRYHLPETMATEQVLAAEDRWSGEEQFRSDGGPLELFFDPTDDGLSPDSLVLLESPPPTTRTDFIGVASHVAGIQVARPVLDALQTLPFGMTPIGLDAILDDSIRLDEIYGPDLDVGLQWLGLGYWGYYGYPSEKSHAVIRGLLSRGFVPLFGRDGEFRPVVGYRESSGDFQMLLGDRNTPWETPDRWWRTRWFNTTVWNPVFYAAAVGEQVPEQALVDSLARVAVTMSRQPELDAEDPLRGAITFPVGLAAWDETVVRWERLELSPAWGAKGRNRQLMSWLRRRHLEPLAQQRETAARLFAWAASRTAPADDLRKGQLEEAARGYAGVAAVMKNLSRRLPQHPWGLLQDEDGERLLHLPSTRGMMAQARDHERSAVTALARMLGQPPLPDRRVDPLSTPGERERLATIRADGGMGVHYVTIRGEEAKVQDFETSEGRQLQVELHSVLPSKSGWQVEMQRLSGLGAYRVVQRPSSENGWRLEVRIQDDNRAWSQEDVELVLWAVRTPDASG